MEDEFSCESAEVLRMPVGCLLVGVSRECPIGMKPGG